MFEHVINTVYIAVIVVYYFPFIATMMLPELTEMGLVDKVPAWVYDTSWKGFWLSPFRMVKDFLD